MLMDTSFLSLNRLTFTATSTKLALCLLSIVYCLLSKKSCRHRIVI